MLAAGVELGAARVVRQRHENQATQLRLPWDDDVRHRREIHPRLVFVPLGGTGRQFLQPQRSSLRVARIAAGVLAAMCEEDRLDFRPERVEIEPLRSGSRRRSLSEHSRTGADGKKEYREQQGCSAHARFIYGGPAGVK